MTGASFEGTVRADSLEAGGDVTMLDAHYAQEVVMHVGGNLDLRDATLASLNLSGAAIAADPRLWGPYKPPGRHYKSPVWTENNGEPGALYLVNTHVGNLVDSVDAWPTQEGYLHLYGFSFGHLGGFGGEAGKNIRERNGTWWDNWARLDPDYNSALYAQLATALTSLGARDVADDIARIRPFAEVRLRVLDDGS